MRLSFGGAILDPDGQPSNRPAATGRAAGGRATAQMPMPPLAPATLGSARPPSPLPRAVAEIAPEEANFKHEKRVGNYWIGRRLGEGAFAKVKEGMHIPTGEKVCLPSCLHYDAFRIVRTTNHILSTEML